ncbi:MAG: AMP-dependent synthetase [Gallionellales bacterium RIFOXYB12_FULL_54_9]|nr:MAG: AMP-dependent synthetase [Gallionellales bacterium RIFOXYB12_FULL_54_9]
MAAVISPEQVRTLHGLFLERVRLTPDKIAYRHFERNAWRDLTWRDMQVEVARWKVALEGIGLQRGDRVAIMLRNCPQWVMFDQAAMSLGLVTVPLYTVDRPDNTAYIVNNAGVRVLLFETAEQWQALRTVREQMRGVLCFISLDNLRNTDESRLKSILEILPVSARVQLENEGEPDVLVSIIYTSGTTGKPKGVMLSHRNMLSNAYASLDTFPVGGEDVFLSFLPLSHTFERTLGYYLPMMAGATVAFARSISLLSEDLQIIRPTLLIAVPRIYERVYGALMTKLHEGSSLKRRLFNLAVDTGWAIFEHKQGRGSWKYSFLLWPLLQRLVAQKILNKLGGRLRVAISGGAALSSEVSRVFVGLGLPMVQGYGLTETSPVISGNRLNNNFPESVGRPVQGVQVRLGAQSELQVTGSNVMLGYWNNEEASRAIIGEDGWLNTGDVAQIADTGHIYITGRIKEIIVMSNGEKIPPNDMEMAILHDPLFEQVMIYGEARPYLVALVVLNPTVWAGFAKEVGIRADMPEALTDSRVESRVLRRIAINLRGFPGYAKVNRVLMLREPWSIDNDLLTPTQKLKRDEVTRRYAAQIKQLYEGH